MAEERLSTESGLDRFIAVIESHASRAPAGWRGSVRVVTALGDECAYIRLSDISRPVQFLRQMAGNPPLRFGVDGFDPAIVDDSNPVRHYMAFVVTGFWLPALASLSVLYAWEVLGFFRYGGKWSTKDVTSGMIGLHHGRVVRRHGPWALPSLVRRDLGMEHTALQPPG